MAKKKNTMVSNFSFIYLFEHFNYDLGLIHIKRRLSKFLRASEEIHFKKEGFVDIYNCPECVCDPYGTERSAGSCDGETGKSPRL